MEFIAELNPEQQQAVMAGSGPVLVMAGPGSGKTRVLTHRIVYLIRSMGVRPYNILAVTFTNKAAREMENRVLELIGENTPGMTLGTFHATCARILRRETAYLPFESNFVIFDSDDQLGLVKRAIKDMDLDDKRYRPSNVHAVISNAKNELLLPDDFPINSYRDEVAQRIYRRYQELLLVSNGLDFDDLLLWTAYLMAENPPVREKYAHRFEHVLVDEFQDTNLAQYTLLKLITSFHKNIFVVGDTDQSIYRWRGADYRNLLRFEKDFPDYQLIMLEQNYRSTQSILDVAMAVINRHPHRTPKHLFTERGQGQKVRLFEAYDDRLEASYVVDTIARQVAEGKSSPGDFAIMYRTNAQSRLLEEAFLRANLPYKLVGAQRFYGRREIKDVIAYMRLVHNPRDEISLTRVINTPPRGIGNKTLLALRTLAQNTGTSPSDLLIESGAVSNSTIFERLSKRARLALHRFGVLFESWTAQKSNLTPLALMDQILQETEYHSYIDDDTDEGHDRWENVMELRRLAADYQEKGLEAFLEQVALVSDQDTIETSSDVPTLLTLHASKGLEFPIVMIVGLNDGTLPHNRSLDDDEEMMEELRLFFVGITRAMNSLHLVYALNRSSFGYSEPVVPSRYLEDIPGELLDSSEPLFQQRRSEYTFSRRSTRWESQSKIEPSNQKAPVQLYHPGMRVQHPSWGEGMVLNSRFQEDDEIVDIFFEDLGMKRVAASLARLEIKSS